MRRCPQATATRPIWSSSRPLTRRTSKISSRCSARRPQACLWRPRSRSGCYGTMRRPSAPPAVSRYRYSARDRSASSLRPGLHLREQGLPVTPGCARHRVQHEPARQLLRGDGKLLLDGQERARRALRQPRGREKWSCSTTSKCSITTGGDTQRWARSVRQRSIGARRHRAWTLSSLWTRRTRPRGTWKPAQNAVSHSAHTIILFVKGRRRTVSQPA